MNRRAGARVLLWLLAGLSGLAGASLARAHDFKAGELRIDHPYAMPTPQGLATGAVYFRSIQNTAAVADRLLSASTPRAGSVEIHQMSMDGDVMRMRAVSALELPPRSATRLRHGSTEGHHLMLRGLTAPLRDGERFPITLRFERAGEQRVMVWVQTPRGAVRDNAPAQGQAHAH